MAESRSDKLSNQGRSFSLDSLPSDHSCDSCHFCKQQPPPPAEESTSELSFKNRAYLSNEHKSNSISTKKKQSKPSKPSKPSKQSKQSQSRPQQQQVKYTLLMFAHPHLSKN